MSVPKGSSKWSGTFQWWEHYPPGEVRKIAKEELNEYQSEYVFCFNYLRDKGWTYSNKKWVSPDGVTEIDKCYEAYTMQKCRDNIGRDEG